MSTRKRAGFTLVELLVVIAIIGILVSLLSAAAMQAINAAQRAACQNNQHEIWTAVQVYENRKQRYPGWRTALAGRQISWAVQLMPYLSMSDIYNNVWANSAATIANSTYTVGSNTLAYPGVKLYVCPSDDQDTPGGPWLSYAVNNGVADTVSGTPARINESKANGLFFDNVVVSSNPIPLFTTASDVQKKDGTSQTLGLGENRRLYNWSGFGQSGTAVLEYLTGFVWDNSGTTPTQSYLLYPINQMDTSSGVVMSSTATDYTGARISGPHGNVAIVTFADGHSIPLNQSINYIVYNKLCTPDGISLGQAPLDPAEYQK